jgi:hypothetical protein
MRNLLLFILAVMTFTWAFPKPMEPLDHYNVVLVHGAAPSGSGFEDECSTTKNVKSAWLLMNMCRTAISYENLMESLLP